MPQAPVQETAPEQEKAPEPVAQAAPVEEKPAEPAPAAQDSEMDVGEFLNDAVPPPATPAAAPQEDDGDDVASVMADKQVERTVPNITKPWMKHHTFVQVKTIEEVRAIVDAALEHGKCSLDIEAEGLDNRMTFDALGNPRTVHQIVGYCISIDGHTGYYIPVRHYPDDGGPDLNVKPLNEVDAEIRRLCRASQPVPTEEGLAKDPLSFRKENFAKAPQVIIYFWNAKFDQEILFPITGLDWWHPDSFEDGMLAAFCHYSADKAFSLKLKAAQWLRDPDGNSYVMIELKELFVHGSKKIQFNKLAPDEPGVVKYGCSDAICTYLLCERPRETEKDRPDYVHLAKTKYEFTYRLEKQVSQVVRVMERYRCMVNRAKAKELLDMQQTELTAILEKIQSFAAEKGWRGLDPSSTAQLSEFLFGNGEGCLNISPKPIKNEASGQYKTDAETLETMVEDNPHAPPILKWIVEYRQVEKLVGTYLEQLHNNPDENNELRFNFKQTGAGTGRFSAPAGQPDQGFSGVPIHGIPNESDMRKLFEARPGFTMVKCDYAGQELRIATNVSGEPVWLKEFLEGEGDLHTITARAFFNKKDVSKDERKMAKIANFALLYGGGPQAIIRATGCDKLEASRRKQAFDKAVPTFAKWIKAQQQRVKKEEGVWTPFRRWLAIPDANNPDRAVQAACERYAVNYPIQGSGADIMKISMVLLHKEFHKRGWLRQGPGYEGDNSVRMLLTVHDEIVFEVRNDRVTEVVPIIVSIMESPAHMTNPKWQVPLITEPLVGPNWGTGYKCERVKPGYKPKEGEYIVNGFVYGTIRTVDLGKDKPGDGEVEHAVFAEKKKVDIRILNAPWLAGVQKTDDVAGPAAPASTAVSTSTAPAEAKAAPPSPPKTPTPPPPVTVKLAKPAGRVVVMKINRLTDQTVRQVRQACVDALDKENGKILKLTDEVGVVLVDPEMGIRVDPTALAKALDMLNLSDGRFVEET
jgi:DNA polymerase I-like protein with 3'-5' exonuclease and polymerase domains